MKESKTFKVILPIQNLKLSQQPKRTADKLKGEFAENYKIYLGWINEVLGVA